MRTFHAAFLVIAVVLFVYAAALYDHSDDLWGNPAVVNSAGLAFGFAAFIPTIRNR